MTVLLLSTTTPRPDLAPAPIPEFDLMAPAPLLFSNFDSNLNDEVEMDGCLEASMAEVAREAIARFISGADDAESEDDSSDYTDDEDWAPMYASDDLEATDMPFNPMKDPSPRMVHLMEQGPKAVAKHLAQQRAMKGKKQAESPTATTLPTVEEEGMAMASLADVAEADAPVVWKRGFPCMTDVDDALETEGGWTGPFELDSGEELFSQEEDDEAPEGVTSMGAADGDGGELGGWNCVGGLLAVCWKLAWLMTVVCCRPGVVDAPGIKIEE